MVARKLLVVALAATLLIGGVAATGAASVQDAQPENDTDADRGDAGPPDDSTDDGNDSAAENGSAADRGNAPADVGPDGEQGPPGDMPANVPDHVVQIHETIDGFLNGEVDDLGNALSELLGGEDAGEEDVENESDDAEEGPDSDDDADDSEESAGEESEDDEDAEDADA